MCRTQEETARELKMQLDEETNVLSYIVPVSIDLE